MKVLSKEKAKVLAEKEGWSLARAEGFIDGEASRSKGKLPSSYARVGIDDYCLGFRAGYYERGGRPGAKPPRIPQRSGNPCRWLRSRPRGWTS